MRSKGMGGFRRFPSSRRYRSRGTLSRSEGEKSWMDISEVGQICVPLISAERRGKAGCTLEEREERETPLWRPPFLSNPKMGLLCYRGGESPASPRRRRCPSDRKILLLFRNEVGHVQPKRDEGCNVI